MENPAILLRRLNPYCARAMEGAASLCQTRAHAEILPEHWLPEQSEGDLTVLARRYEWDMMKDEQTELLTHMAAKQKPQSLRLTWSEEEGIGLEFDRTQGVSA